MPCTSDVYNTSITSPPAKFVLGIMVVSSPVIWCFSSTDVGDLIAVIVHMLLQGFSSPMVLTFSTVTGSYGAPPFLVGNIPG